MGRDIELSKKDKKELIAFQTSPEQSSIKQESDEDRYDRTLFGWVFLIPLIARILVGISWADYWQIIMDVTFVFVFYLV